MQRNKDYPIKNTIEVFKRLRIEKNLLSKRQKKFLETKGYLIIKPTNFMKKNLRKLNLAAKKLIKKEGKKGGWEGKEKYYKKGKDFEIGANRLGNLIDKKNIFRKLITMPEILAAAHSVIKGNIKICGFNLRNPLRGHGNQAVHMDWKPRKKKKDSYGGVVCMIYLDKSKKSNGATRLIPHSHKKIGWPEYHIDVNKRHKKEIRPELEAGSIIVANLNLWHAGAENISGKARKMIMLNIKRRNLPQLLNYKKFLTNKTKKSLNEVEKYLLAVRKIDKTQKFDSIGVGKYYYKEFNKKNFSRNIKQKQK